MPILPCLWLLIEPPEFWVFVLLLALGRGAYQDGKHNETQDGGHAQEEILRQCQEETDHFGHFHGMCPIDLWCLTGLNAPFAIEGRQDTRSRTR